MGEGFRLQRRRALLEHIAPSYHSAPPATKRVLLDAFTQATGYHRTYARWLLNHSEEVLHAQTRHPRPHHYGPEVQDALVLAWNAANRICTKRLMPFLPTLLDALERHGHLHLTQACRTHLLSMSAATADRLLRASRLPRPSGLSTTHAGPLLKQQIPIRTFQQWHETQPGFVEADLVAHCGMDRGAGFTGGFVCTLTLTDVATGWTECLPLLYPSQETVLAAIHHARHLFPFPILGIDTDNGGEFINEEILAYCEREHLTFTRGRPRLKNDQCYIEQKNRTIVRQVVGYDRLVGEQASRQLGELYRALRLYVNCFQPSMKLLSKQRDGRHLSYHYDPAKTPLQRLLLSGILPAMAQQELGNVAQALDPIRLFEQLRHLQQAVFCCAVDANPFVCHVSSSPLHIFTVEQCTVGLGMVDRSIPDPPGGLPTLYQQQEKRKRVLGWRRTHNDPFKGEWERIASWVQATPERSSGDIFCELQRLSPGRYQPLQIRTLQRGMRTIRANLLSMVEESWPEEIIHGQVPDPIVAGKPEQEGERSTCSMCATTLPSSGLRFQRPASEAQVPHHPITAAEAPRVPETAIPGVVQLSQEPYQAGQTFHAPTRSTQSRPSRSLITIDHAIQEYLQDQQRSHRRPKTLEWHQTALGLFQQYLTSKRHLVLLRQITQSAVRDWLMFLRQTPTASGTHRSVNTIQSYARSARAFCQWAVRHRSLERTPFAQILLPKGEKPLLHLIEPQEWEQLLLACHPPGENDARGDRATGRNQAILWVLFDTGIRVSELCALRVGDVDRKQRCLRIGGKTKERRITFSPNGWDHVLSYLHHDRSKETGVTGGHALEDHLFLSERSLPLTTNAITLLFDRLQKRAGIAKERVSPSVLRDTFAVRYLEAGGEREALQKQLGLGDGALITRYEHRRDQQRKAEKACIGSSPQTSV